MFNRKYWSDRQGPWFFTLLAILIGIGAGLTGKVYDSHAADKPYMDVLFSVPGERTLIENINWYIGQAERGSSILMAYYLFDDVPTMASLIAAKKRGVNIKILIQKNKTNKVLKSFASEICSDRRKKCIHSCKKSCVGRSMKKKLYESINHMKFVLFSRLQNGQRNVVIQTSSNLYKTSKNYFQDMLVFSDHPQLYRAYEDHFLTMIREDARQHYFRPISVGSGTKVHFFPEPTGSDTVSDLFDEIDCSRRSTIHVGMAYFYDDRVVLANKLRELYEEGCVVKLISGVYWDDYPTYSSPGYAVSNVLGELLVKIETDLHSKFVLLDVVMKDGGGRKKIVLTGSYNFTWTSSYQNDEVLLSLENRKLYDKYLEYWQRIKRHSTPASRDRTRKVEVYHLAHAIKQYEQKSRSRLISRDELIDCDLGQGEEFAATDCRIDRQGIISRRFEVLVRQGYLGKLPMDPTRNPDFGYFVQIKESDRVPVKRKKRRISSRYQICANRFEEKTSVYTLKPYCVTVAEK